MLTMKRLLTFIKPRREKSGFDPKILKTWLDKFEEKSQKFRAARYT